ncbi:histidine kinase [Methylobacterium tarhaniae]|uniref:histidine kinase n=1 Tax=Methylobacterium tarhaniae TaxID=1187852 RepID=A0A0J6VYL6_9HYPH|nr:CHASE domain-containing protein [Methylobacterium tarhaniae]KMO44446.1 histidine kinase [Methylobacterium tarhaniae]
MGLVATGLGTALIWRAAEMRDRLTFLHATDIELRSVEDQFRTYTALLRGGAGLFAANDDTVTLAQFRAYVQRIEFQTLYPGILGIGFTPAIQASERERFAAKAETLGVPGFRVRPSSDHPVLSPVLFAEPPNARNQAAIGYDVMSDPVRRDMVERARDTGLPAASARIQLVQEIDANKQAGFLVAMPVYAGGVVPAELDERRRRYLGFVFGAFRADDLFNSIVAAEAEQDAAFAIYDGTPSAATLLHRSARNPDAVAGRLTREATIELGGRVWTVRFEQRLSPRRASALPEIGLVCGGGLFATALLGFAAFRQRRIQDEIRRLNASLEARVEDRTRDLRQAAESLRQAGEERARMEEVLRQSQKMEAVGQLTGGLAHDFNNLLAGISGSLELIETRIGQGRSKDVAKYIAAAQGASKRAAALTHRLLAFSRRQTLAPKAVDANRLVDGMLDLIQRTVGPGIDLRHRGADDLWPALVDPSQLENSLLNLCINARDAMPEGGRIVIETENRWVDRRQAEALDVPEGQYLSLCVSDTGTGMPPEVVARAFDPFFTTKPMGEGTGLGLSMIYGFAKQSGGQVRIVSEVGAGTTVCLYLPRHRGEADAEGPDPGKRPMAHAEAGETVLIVDDEPTVRMLVADVLNDLGYTAVEAADGAGGLRVLQSDARVDLLVTDVGLPGGMNGRQMADAARVGRPDLKVLFITGFAETTLLGNGQLEPGMAVLTKPFAVEALAARIREMIAP